MTTPYREEARSELAAFKLHIEVAETLLGVHADFSRALVHDTDDLGELRRARGEAWGNLWVQIEEARAIVARLGRDLGPFEAERVRAGNPYLIAAGMTRVDQGMLAATTAAIAALRAAVPEVVIPVARPEPGSEAPAAAGITWMTPMVRFQIGSLVVAVIVALARC